jgi:hypothetical protein
MLKFALRSGLLSIVFLAACVRPTPTPTLPPAGVTSVSPNGGYPAVAPTNTPNPGSYPAPAATPPAPEPTAGPGTPYPATS